MRNDSNISSMKNEDEEKEKRRKVREARLILV